MNPVVVVDAKALMYSRYDGKKRTHKAVCNLPLTGEEVETLRVQPHVLFDPRPLELWL